MYTYQLNCDVLVRADGEVLLVGRKSVSLGRFATASLSLLNLLSKGIDSELLAKLKSTPATTRLVTGLQSRGLIVRGTAKVRNTPLERSAAFIARTAFDSEEAMSRLQSSNVAVLGCGGLGANVAYALAASGVENFFLLDEDCVEPSNLNRQFPFSPADVGREKVAALHEHLTALNPALTCTTLRKRINSVNDLHDALPTDLSLIICGIDSPPVVIKKIVTTYSIDSNTAVAFGGAGYDLINIGPLLTTTDSKLDYINVVDSQLAQIDPDLTRPLAGSLCSVNSLMTAALSNQILNYLGGINPPSEPNVETFMNPWTLAVVNRRTYGEP